VLTFRSVVASEIVNNYPEDHLLISLEADYIEVNYSLKPNEF